jgi:hypothetical protein
MPLNDAELARKVLEAALDYATQGLFVFPCRHRTKEPAVHRGFYSATTNPATIHRWFGGTVDFNIAVRTGLISGIMVLDVDDRHGGFDGLRELEERYGPPPPTRTCRTANGVHLWFGITHEVASRKEGLIAKGIGTKANNTYVMVPPSVHPDGPVYTWDDDARLAVAPDWLLKLTRKPAPITLPPRTPNGLPGAYGAAALQREIEILAGTAPGGRNTALNRASFSLHQLVAGGELDGSDVERELLAAAEANGLVTDPKDGPRKVRATIDSGRRAGLQHPRSRP